MKESSPIGLDEKITTHPMMFTQQLLQLGCGHLGAQRVSESESASHAVEEAHLMQGSHAHLLATSEHRLAARRQATRSPRVPACDQLDKGQLYQSTGIWHAGFVRHGRDCSCDDSRREQQRATAGMALVFPMLSTHSQSFQAHTTHIISYRLLLVFFQSDRAIITSTRPNWGPCIHYCNSMFYVRDLSTVGASEALDWYM